MSSAQQATVEAAALAALMCADPAEKAIAVRALLADWQSGALLRAGRAVVDGPVCSPGRPPRPELVSPDAVPRRAPGSREGHAALLHAVAHIEFNAINLALDCVARFWDQPDEFVTDWLGVAVEEAYHFGLVCGRLAADGYAYGDFPAHNGLWDMCCDTAGDFVARMALVPRLLEARGLDATPPMIAKLIKGGDADTVAVLQIILRDEIGHVAIGDRWFRAGCAARGLQAESAYRDLIVRFDAPWPKPPFNVPARLQAGFSQNELDRLANERPAPYRTPRKPA
ncbi:ferritin-like domain-containing protein [Niveibacterium microcysteis]|uniref:Ferritin-like domain-containing protein n=1 Tax=Niveibacterium microcysteis TaxID=2811415 RepID=A0ABX7MBE3_9RHOO|nr:ferritin-like domain-containing protein [Niveibacterium microcysteis]QSI78468.1 ferritin-like domain-containing protein [Niveibacterium microcysteis]